MPLYEYQCGSCGSVFEVRQKFSDDPVTVHENCGGSVRRLLTAPSFHFKGSGWYITDYARAGATENGKSEKSEKGESKSAEAKSDAKSDTKDTKSDTKSESKSDSASSSTKSTESAKPASTSTEKK
jgi:putative FmdB family regulatory protein